jgi:hypothetical protein
MPKPAGSVRIMPNGGLGLVRNRHRYIGSSVDATQLFARSMVQTGEDFTQQPDRVYLTGSAERLMGTCGSASTTI